MMGMVMVKFMNTGLLIITFNDYCYEDFLQGPVSKRQRLTPAENEGAKTSDKQKSASGNEQPS